MQQSTKTNSESEPVVSDKHPVEDRLDCSISTASDDEATDEYDNMDLRAAFSDLKAAPWRITQISPEASEEDSIGKRLVDRKRLRIFAKITDKKKSDEVSLKLKSDSSKSGSFLKIQMQKC